ncbi:MAG: pilin [Patescibacteria group bacterium]
MIKSKFNFAKLSLGVIFGLQLAAATLIFSSPLPASAQTKIQSLNFVPQVSIPNSEFNGSVSVGSYNDKTGTISSDLLARYIKAFYNYGLAAAGILAALILMGGGVLWLTSGGDAGKVGQAKELITGSIVGVVILVCAWVILNTINPNLVNLQPIETTVVKKIAYCCDSKLGNVMMDKDGNCPSGKACENGLTCLKMDSTSYSCAENRICCQCGVHCVGGICPDILCKNDTTVQECDNWCENEKYLGTGWASAYYAGGSKSYECKAILGLIGVGCVKQ